MNLKNFLGTAIGMLFVCVSAQSEVSLKLHYDLENDTIGSTTVTDVSGNGYTGTLKGSATVAAFQKKTVVKLGGFSGAVDLGERFGEVVAGLTDYTVAVTAYISSASNLTLPGNVVCSFSNSENIRLSDKGYMYIGAGDCGVHLSTGTVEEESAACTSIPCSKGIWKTFVWTQRGEVVRFYQDGVLLFGGRVTHTPSELGPTTYNTIGAPLNADDSFLKNTYISDFRLYSGALTSAEVAAFSGVAYKTDKATLVAQFDFTSANSTDGRCKGSVQNQAELTTIAGLPVLALGTGNGYFDLGTELGEQVSMLDSFTLSTNVYIPSTAALGTAGNFIFTFANSADMGSTANGCLFFGANECRYAISTTNYRDEEAVSLNTPFERGVWHTLTLRQIGGVGQLFLDGLPAVSGALTLSPKALGKTTCNYLGRSCYTGDAYLKGAMYHDFRLYSGALDDEPILDLATHLDQLNGELFAQQIQEQMNLTTLSAQVLYEDIELPSVGQNGVSITWSTSDEAHVSASGKVNRPAVGADSARVILTATFTKKQLKSTKTFAVTVVPRLDDTHSVQADKERLQLNGNLMDLKSDLYLPSLTTEGSIISWRSSRPDYLNHSGKLQRLSPKGQKQQVVLTATLWKGEYTDSCTFEVTIGEDEGYTGYLFAYFTGNSQSQEQIRFAISADGYNYFPLNEGEPIISSDSIALKKAVRDPHILRGEDGYFYMVVTDMRSSQGWSSNDGLVLMRSADLVNWTHTAIDFPNTWPERFDRTALTQVWAPQTIFDPSVGKYMVYYSIGEAGQYYKIYYSYANEDFTALTEPKVLYDHGANTIDGDIVYANGRYHLFFKTEGNGNGIQKATAPTLQGPWTSNRTYLQQTNVSVEGSGVFKLINSDTWVLMYDCYTSGHYQYCSSTDLEKFTYVCNSANSGNYTPRHGTTIPITTQEAQRLVARWPSASLSIRNIVTDSRQVRAEHMQVNNTAQTVYLPLTADADITSFDPQLHAFPGTTVTPEGPQDFSKGAVAYTFAMGPNKQTYSVTAQTCVNPVLPGYHADPEVMYSKKTGRFYLYTTTDGLAGWAGTYFTAYSSSDLVNWTYEANIIDLATAQVIWASGNAWAPAIEEVEQEDGTFKYYYYFSGNAGSNKQIGVAVAPSPVGPFVDHGSSIIATSPAGRGQQIDVDVFTDSVTGTPYIYWGNGYMACAELEVDRVTLKYGTTKVITPTGGTLANWAYREAPYVFYRGGLYYFLWSVDDTGSNNYHVAYGTSTSPTGPITVADKPIVLIQSPANEIYGTAHNSILQIPGRDEWYIVYHRINRSWQGVTGSGYHRETCIDRLYFNPDGTIRQVTPTHQGPAPVSAFEVATQVKKPQMAMEQPVVKENFFTLQGVCVGDTLPVSQGVYICRQTLADNTVQVRKQLVR